MPKNLFHTQVFCEDIGESLSMSFLKTYKNTVAEVASATVFLGMEFYAIYAKHDKMARLNGWNDIIPFSCFAWYGTLRRGQKQMAQC